HPHGQRLLGHHRDRAHPRRRALAPDRLGALTADEHRHAGALEQQDHALGGGALLGDHGAGGVVVGLRDRGPFGELGVVEIVEQVDRAQIGDGVLAHVSERYWWTRDTAIEPSPTALATRLIERERTSPATNTPGTLVSSRYGSRGSGQPSAFASSP